MLVTIIPKAIALREEDYWLIPVSFIAIVFIAITIYASVLTFRVPALVIAAIGTWFTWIEIKKGYGSHHAWLHIMLCIGLGVLLFLGIFALTN